MDAFGDIDLSDVVPLILLGAIEHTGDTQPAKTPRSTGLPGAEYLRELLDCGSHKRIYLVLRITKETFNCLCLWLRKNSDLVDTCYILINEQVAMFLWIINFDVSIEATAERF
jgi:hypothetical protein